MDTLIVTMTVLAALALTFPLVRQAFRLGFGPDELHVAKWVVMKLRWRNRPTYDILAEIDKTMLAWRTSEFPRIRLVGRFLQTWEMQLSQESMAEKPIDVAGPMDGLYKALRKGDYPLINEAFGRLIDQVETPSGSEKPENVEATLFELLVRLSEAVAKGNRDVWRKDTSELKKWVRTLPAEIRPSVYLLVGYLESPLYHTEVCVNRAALEEQTSSLSRLVREIADRINRGIERSSSDLLNTLGRYEKSNWPAARPAGQAAA